MIARDCRKALYGILLGAIFFMTLLPYFGWAWHRVLPEHSHVFLGTGPVHEKHTLPEPTADNQRDLQTADPSATVIHIPDPAGVFQVFAIAIALIASPLVSIPTGFSFSVILTSLFYKSPSLPLLDPPPTAN